MASASPVLGEDSLSEKMQGPVSVAIVALFALGRGPPSSLGLFCQSLALGRGLREFWACWVGSGSSAYFQPF